MWPVHLAAATSSHAGTSDPIATILAALAVILAALGLMFTLATVGLALAAVIGYKDLIRLGERKMEAVLAKYPSAEAIQAQLMALKDTMRTEITSKPEPQPKTQPPASNSMVPSGAAQTEESKPVSPTYPTKEASDAISSSDETKPDAS